MKPQQSRLAFLILSCSSLVSATSHPPTPRPTKRKENRPARKKPMKKPVQQVSTTVTNPTTFSPGDLTVDVKSLGMKLSTGMSVKILARANQKVHYANGERSPIPFHSMPDGAAVFPLTNGYVYVSNSEMRDGNGGVYALYFDTNGDMIDYKQLLSGTTRNCSGGKTPWKTWISCEEYGKGQCWQVDPDPSGKHHTKPEMTRLGQDGGSFEAVAFDDSNPARPIFYLTEDAELGALRRYRPKQSSGWTTLHEEGGVAKHDYLEFLDGKSFQWTSDIDAARESQQKYYRNVEGIDYYDGILSFVSKKTYMLYALDLAKFTYTTTSTTSDLFGDGEFTNTPDQIIRGKRGNILYFTEDGGKTCGVYALMEDNRRYAIFEAYDQKYSGDETTGLAFSPDGKKMYSAFQDCGCKDSESVDFSCGCLLEFSRDDGKPFDGSTLGLKFRSR